MSPELASKVKPVVTPACPPHRLEGTVPCAVTGEEGNQALLLGGMSMEALGPLSLKFCELPLGHFTDTCRFELFTVIVFAMEFGSATDA